MPTVEARVASITDDRRASYLWQTKAASDAVGCHPNKFNDWWQRTRAKLIELHVAAPGETAAELAALIALAESERQRREAPTPQCVTPSASRAQRGQRPPRPRTSASPLTRS